MESSQFLHEAILILTFYKEGNKHTEFERNKITSLLLIKPELESHFLNFRVHSHGSVSDIASLHQYYYFNFKAMSTLWNVM